MDVKNQHRKDVTPLTLKTKVAYYAEYHGSMSASKKFNIPQTTINDWENKKKQIIKDRAPMD